MHGVLLVEPPEQVGVCDPLIPALGLLEGLITVDWGERLMNDERLVVYCGRYGHQDMGQVETWPRSTLIRRAKLLNELLEAEQKAGRPPE